MAVQSDFKGRFPGTPSEQSPLGIPALGTVPSLQTEVYKELVNKFAWVLGSTYRRPYSNRRSMARSVATRIAFDFVTEHGYPDSIRKP